MSLYIGLNPRKERTVVICPEDEVRIYSIYLTDGSYSLPRLPTCNLLLYYFCLFISSLSKIASLMPPAFYFRKADAKVRQFSEPQNIFEEKNRLNIHFSDFPAPNQVHLLIYIIGHGLAGHLPHILSPLRTGIKRNVRTFYRKERKPS